MIKLRLHRAQSEARDTIPFPGLRKEASLRPRLRLTGAGRFSDDSARDAQAALADVERRFQNLKDLVGEWHDDDDRPRAA